MTTSYAGLSGLGLGFLGLALGLGLVAALVLRSRRYRLDDDTVHRTVGVWWVPVLSLLGALLGAPFFASRPPLVVLTYVLALVWAVVLAVIDLEVRRLPDVLTLPAYGVVALLLAGCSWVTGDQTALLRAAACAGAAVAVFLLAALVSPGSGGLGLGDVKLAGVLGALLGWLGWVGAVMGLLSGFVLGGVVAVVLLLARRADRRSSIAFGPAMLLGAYVWCLLSAAV